MSEAHPERTRGILRVVVLPGLDGTGKLLAPFAAQCDGHVVSYPPERVLAFDDYVEIAAAAVTPETLLVAESFSGPIAIRIAARQPVRALVLAGSFVTAPLPRILRMLPLTTLARLQVPDWLLSRAMLGGHPGVSDFREAIGEVDPRVIASRLRIALSIDERANLASTTVPLLDLRGTQDRLVSVRARRAILNARPDAMFADLEAPHALLYTNAAEAWRVITAKQPG